MSKILSPDYSVIHDSALHDSAYTFSFTRFFTKPICDIADCILKIILDIKMVDINIAYMSYVHYFGFAPNTSLSE
jgi:hypothetical protein